MMLKRLMVTMIPVGFLVVSGCTWVKATPKGELVTVAETVQVLNHCNRLGTTTAKGVSKVGFVIRGEEKVAKELIALAKNSAADMGGNAIIATSPVQEGSQNFAVYLCP